MKKKPTIVISPVSHEYLTKGKEYIIKKWINDTIFIIKDNFGNDIYCSSIMCAHLNNLSWTLK